MCWCRISCKYYVICMYQCSVGIFSGLYNTVTKCENDEQALEECSFHSVKLALLFPTHTSQVAWLCGQCIEIFAGIACRGSRGVLSARS